MPEHLDTVGRSKKGMRNSFVEAIKNRSYRFRANHKLKEGEPQDQADLDGAQAESGDFQSFTSRW